jgi:glycosyltransferase involved in cell wall biosynthesis
MMTLFDARFEEAPPPILLSVVVPVYQGEDCLDELAAELAAVREQLEQDGTISLTEVILVDDGAVDGSARVMDALSSKFPWITSIHLSRNFGQHSATVAGILHSCGDWVATIDEDLQHHPKFLLPLLRHTVEQGHDLTFAKPMRAVHESFVRDFSSRSVKTLTKFLTRNEHVTKFNSFRMIRGQIARAAASVATERTYFDVALTWFTDRIGLLPLPLKDRRFIAQRSSGYNLRSLARHAVRLLLGCELKVLRAGALVGVATLILSVVLSGIVVVKKVFFPESVDLAGWSSLIIAVLFSGGLLASLLGVCLEYLSVLVLRTLGRPTFFVIDRSKDAVLFPQLSGESRPMQRESRAA